MQLASVMDLASPEHFGTLGDNRIDTLVEHFDRALQEAGVETADEWTTFKAGVHSDYSLSQVSQPSNWEEYIKSVTWAKLHKNYCEETPNLLNLVNLVLSLPTSTAE